VLRGTIRERSKAANYPWRDGLSVVEIELRQEQPDPEIPNTKALLPLRASIDSRISDPNSRIEEKVEGSEDEAPPAHTV
jgi:hypothetical protein